MSNNSTPEPVVVFEKRLSGLGSSFTVVKTDSNFRFSGLFDNIGVDLDEAEVRVLISILASGIDCYLDLSKERYLEFTLRTVGKDSARVTTNQQEVTLDSDERHSLLVALSEAVACASAPLHQPEQGR